jgi:hypothetical protein
MKDNHDLIAQLACDLYRNSGHIQGRDLDNWLDAERLVSAGQYTDAMLFDGTD